MGLRKSFLFIMIGLLFIMTACGNDENNNEENEKDEENEANEDVASIQFPELDLSNLGDNVVAEFEGGEIVGEDFATFLGVQAFLNPEAPVNDLDYRNESIKELIMEKILIDNVEDDSWADEQTDLLWEEIETIYTEEELEDAYEKLHLPNDDIRQTLNDLYKVESYFREQVTEDEVNELYEAAKTQLTTATFTHILIGLEEMNEDGEMEEVRTEEEALEKANDLYDQLMDGADMNELASENSDDPGSVNTGGTYEDSAIMQLVPEFRDAILEQEIDEIGEPVKTDYGYHIIRVEDLQTTPLDEVREAVVAQITFEKYTNYLSEDLPEQITELNLE